MPTIERSTKQCFISFIYCDNALFSHFKYALMHYCAERIYYSKRNASVTCLSAEMCPRGQIIGLVDPRGQNAVALALCSIKQNIKYIQTQIKTYKVKWTQCDKTRSRGLTIRTAHVSVLITVHNCHTQHSMGQFRLSSFLTSRQATQLRYCLLEGRGNSRKKKYMDGSTTHKVQQTDIQHKCERD